MALEEDLLSLIGSFYDAAVDQSLWPQAMERLIAITESQAASFCIIDRTDQPRMPVFIPVHFREDHIDEYLDFMAPYDPTLQHIVAHPKQKIHHDSTFISEREKDNHPYFDWHHRFSDTRHRIAGISNATPAIQAGITIHRTRSQGDFDAELLRRFTLLFQHIERALQIGFRLGDLGNLQQASLDILDRNPLGIILLDDKGRVILVNKAARELIDDADGLTLTFERLELLHRQENQKLQRLVGDALRSKIHSGTLPGGAMSALRPSGKRPYSILVAPVSGSHVLMATRQPAACIVVADSTKHRAIPLTRLRAIYGLSRSEVLLAERLLQGDDLQRAALSLGIAYSTARTQLTSIFRKTETNRQGELIRLLIATIASIA